MEIAHLQEWIGREQLAEETVTPALIARFCATLDLPPPDLATPAPLALHWCMTQDAVNTQGLGPDGHPARGGFIPPVPLPRRMWAGGALDFHDDLFSGDRLQRRSTLRDVRLKDGRSGPLIFVTVDHQLSTPRGPLLSERQDIVFRDQGGPAPATITPAPAGTWRQSIAPGAAMLFRYSALTWNSHRIHYDRTWAVKDEGYPGLVVHGPLQATLLLQAAHSLRGRRPARFRFRSLSPLFDTQDMQLNACDTDEGLALWTSRPGGPIAMEALAAW